MLFDRESCHRWLVIVPILVAGSACASARHLLSGAEFCNVLAGHWPVGVWRGRGMARFGCSGGFEIARSIRPWVAATGLSQPISGDSAEITVPCGHEDTLDKDSSRKYLLSINVRLPNLVGRAKVRLGQRNRLCNGEIFDRPTMAAIELKNMAAPRGYAVRDNRVVSGTAGTPAPGLATAMSYP